MLLLEVGSRTTPRRGEVGGGERALDGLAAGERAVAMVAVDQFGAAPRARRRAPSWRPPARRPPSRRAPRRRVSRRRSATARKRPPARRPFGGERTWPCPLGLIAFPRPLIVSVFSVSSVQHIASRRARDRGHRWISIACSPALLSHTNAPSGENDRGARNQRFGTFVLHGPSGARDTPARNRRAVAYYHQGVHLGYVLNASAGSPTRSTIGRRERQRYLMRFESGLDALAARRGTFLPLLLL